jgi:hypothetical protein
VVGVAEVEVGVAVWPPGVVGVAVEAGVAVWPAGVVGVAVAGPPTRQSQIASKKFTVRRSLASGAAAEKPSHRCCAASWRHIVSTLPAGLTASRTAPLAVPSLNVRPTLLQPGYSCSTAPGGGRVMLATGCARPDDQSRTTRTVRTASIAVSPMSVLAFTSLLLLVPLQPSIGRPLNA